MDPLVAYLECLSFPAVLLRLWEQLITRAFLQCCRILGTDWGVVRLLVFAIAQLLSLSKLQTTFPLHLCFTKTSEPAARLQINIRNSRSDYCLSFHPCCYRRCTWHLCPLPRSYGKDPAMPSMKDKWHQQHNTAASGSVAHIHESVEEITRLMQ